MKTQLGHKECVPFYAENESAERLFSEGLFNLYPPVLKEYLSVNGHDVSVQAIQVFDGTTDTQDYPVEQYAVILKLGI